ncbi:MAG: uracil-DNA glycosylase [Spirochaetaceae bacterium]|nr:uracil-DNA glycosylase [Spirochaetaceae bacterium]
MISQDKQQIYQMLHKIANWAYGYPAPGFTTEIPNFCEESKTENKSSNTETILQNISEKIQNCKRCSLCKDKMKSVPGMGVLNPIVMVIGEGPGADEDATGLPFVGKAGQLLDKMLAAISLSRTENCFIANIVKCRPPGNRDPLPEEIDACRSYLEAQISVLKPTMILTLGRIATQTLLNSQDGIGRLHGQFHEYNGIPIMATYHPSALLRNQELKRPAWDDLKAFRSKLEQLVPDYNVSFKAGQK